MKTLHSRVDRLEAKNTRSGPVIMSWRLGESRRARTEYDGREFRQATGETQNDFFRRVAGSIPADAVVWMDELDEML